VLHGIPRIGRQDGASGRAARWEPAAWLVAFLVLIQAGCGSPETKYKVLSFFFDGVPPPGDGAKAGKGAEKEDDSKGIVPAEKANEKPTQASKKPKTPLMPKHPPYADRKCLKCHKSLGSGAAVLADSCFGCHPRKEIVPEHPHDPVEEGSCTECHDPHESPNEHFLRKKPQELCAECHDYDDDDFAARHEPLTDRRCTACHNAHGGDGPGFIGKGDVGEKCAKCHNLHLASRAYRHGPVDAGLCLECHGSHEAPGVAHLKRKGDALCLGCHSKTGLRSRPAHRKRRLSDCLGCHDPHGSKRRFMLKWGKGGSH